MTKIADLEADFTQFKTTTDERLNKIESAVDSLAIEVRKAASDTDKRFTELLTAIRALQQPPTTVPSPTSLPTTQTSPSSLPLVPTSLRSQLPSSATTQPFVPFAPPSYDAHGRPLPTHYMTDTAQPSHSRPPPHPVPSNQQPPIIRPSTHPVVFNSRRVFDEFGYPISTGTPPQFTEVNGSFSGSSYVAPRQDTHVPHVGHAGTRCQDPPLYGLDQPENRVWVPGAEHRLRKLKMPLFEGQDVYGWIYRIERFFDIQGLVTTGEKLRAAVLCMEGQALSWFRWSDQRSPFRSWDHLKLAMLDRFQPSHEGDLYEQLLSIKQEGTVREYVNLFESLAAQLDDLPEQILLGTFLTGLNPDIRASVRVLQPNGLIQTMKLAIMIGDSRATEPLKGAPAKQPSLAAPTEGPQPREPPGPPLRRMTDAEYWDRKAKGLCFRCNGKFGPGHRCPAKDLQLMLVQDDDKEDPGGAHAHTE